MATPEEIAKEMEASVELFERMERKPSPFRGEIGQLMGATNAVEDVVNTIVGRWKAEFLATSVAHDKANPHGGQDYENYSTPLIVPTEILRRRGFNELAHRIYLYAVKAVDNRQTADDIDLHRGALYADLGITYLERKQHELGLSWLLAAANEDVRFNRIAKYDESHAMSRGGIYGQWVESSLVPAIPEAVMDFVNDRLGTAYGTDQLMELLRSLSGQGDLNLFAGVLNFEAVRDRSDFVGDSVRFICLRDLATLLEVVLKRIGAAHADPLVVDRFRKGPTLAKVIYIMHYQHFPLTAANRHQHKPGLFRNAVVTRQDILDAIEVGFPFTSDHTANNLIAVHAHLAGTTLSADPHVDAISKRLLLGLRLRNDTSHSFKAGDAGIVTHAEDFRLWLLQIIFYCYFSFRDTAQASF